jgi:hypothetical protein
VQTETAVRETVGESGADPRVAPLREAVERMRRELDAYPVELSDRQAAEEGLATLAAAARAGAPEVRVLRGCLLLVAATLGSVSALRPALTRLRETVELFGEPVRPGWSAGP